MLQVFAWIAERRIEEAMRQGAFDDLEGKGKKIVFEDDSMIPEDLRMAYKILKNAGYVPEELLEEKEIVTATELLAAATDEQERYRQMQKLNLLVMKVNARRRRPVNLEKEQVYFQKVVERVSVRPLAGKSRSPEEEARTRPR
ncbi:DnaJ family domain-containing protein [Solidesulfovibrio sp.]|uniref:DnaJ family domain-containing protein n=1 Tax=Solidesulfovibrio sp. TaxID=2910990 RepID=UPI0026189109|nr:DnaJ family domain-containing protein [Solidesulfovibrio sp.]